MVRAHELVGLHSQFLQERSFVCKLLVLSLIRLLMLLLLWC